MSLACGESSERSPISSPLADRLLAWFDRHGRHDLPWQQARTPYRVWVAEIMLQQTQVATVLPYYARFMARFPDVATLVGASIDEVLAHWSGLGYYARGRNLHRAARVLVDQYGGEFPRTRAAVEALPGIGRSTAAAILAQAYGERHAILDGNAKRVLARWHGVTGWPGAGPVLKRLWAHAEANLPEARLADYTQAIMDLGATVCTRSQPRCGACPLAADCEARRAGLTGEIPAPRPRRTLPERETGMLLLINQDGESLLQRRPPTGIWGGLWCFPELDAEAAGDGASLAKTCGELFDFDVAGTEWLSPRRHTFTHFRLTVHPVRLTGHPAGARALEGRDLLWYKPGTHRIGLAAPVRDLLTGGGPAAPSPTPASGEPDADKQ